MAEKIFEVRVREVLEHTFKIRADSADAARWAAAFSIDNAPCVPTGWPEGRTGRVRLPERIRVTAYAERARDV